MTRGLLQNKYTMIRERTWQLKWYRRYALSLRSGIHKRRRFTLSQMERRSEVFVQWIVCWQRLLRRTKGTGTCTSRLHVWLTTLLLTVVLVLLPVSVGSFACQLTCISRTPPCLRHSIILIMLPSSSQGWRKPSSLLGKLWKFRSALRRLTTTAGQQLKPTKLETVSCGWTSKHVGAGVWSWIDHGRALGKLSSGWMT